MGPDNDPDNPVRHNNLHFLPVPPFLRGPRPNGQWSGRSAVMDKRIHVVIGSPPRTSLMEMAAVETTGTALQFAHPSLRHRADHGFTASSCPSCCRCSQPRPALYYAASTSQVKELPPQTRQRIASHHVADCNGDYGVYLSGFDELALCDYINHATPGRWG